jgi:acetyl/propionyl-CoA carboxylase alpha subunit
VVSVNYDPLLAKVIAYGATRSEAVRKLAAALRRAHIHGITTNRDLLVGVLEHPEFAAGRIDTHFLDRNPPAGLIHVVPDSELGWYAFAAAVAEQCARRQRATVWATTPSGWRNNRSALQTRFYTGESGTVEVGYALEPDGRFDLDGAPVAVEIGAVTPECVELIVGGVRRHFDVHEDGEVMWVDSARGNVRLERQPRFPQPETLLAAGSLVAPMPGVVVRVDVAAGDRVDKGQSLVVLEAMKMEHTVTAPTGGTVVAVNVTVGHGVDAGAVLVVIGTDDDNELESA